MSSDSTIKVSVGVGQLLVEGKGTIGAVEYTLVEMTTPSGSKSSEWTVADMLVSNGGPDSGRRVDFNDLQAQNAPLILIHLGGSFPCMIGDVDQGKATLVPRRKW